MSFDGTGTVGILDLLALLANWGALYSCSESSAVEPGEGQMGNVGFGNVTLVLPADLEYDGRRDWHTQLRSTSKED